MFARVIVSFIMMIRTEICISGLQTNQNICPLKYKISFYASLVVIQCYSLVGRHVTILLLFITYPRTSSVSLITPVNYS